MLGFYKERFAASFCEGGGEGVAGLAGAEDDGVVCRCCGHFGVETRSGVRFELSGYEGDSMRCDCTGNAREHS